MKIVKNIDTNYPEEWRKFVRESDMKSLSIIYLGHFDNLFGYGKKMNQRDQLIEDAIQNVFSYFIRNRKSLPELENIRGYLISSFHHELFRLKKSEQNPDTLGTPVEQQFIAEYSVEDEIINDENKKGLNYILFHSLKKLTPYQQEVLYLKFDCDLSYEEIAKTLDISIESSRTLVYRTIKSLRTDIKKNRIKGIQLFLAFFKPGTGIFKLL